MSRELDVAIAEARGYRVKESLPTGWLMRTPERWFKVPYWSTDGNAMLELDKEMQKRGWYYTISHTIDLVTPFMATYSKRNGTEDNPTCVANTEPLARALAAYYALTGKEWEEVLNS